MALILTNWWIFLLEWITHPHMTQKTIQTICIDSCRLIYNEYANWNKDRSIKNTVNMHLNLEASLSPKKSKDREQNSRWVVIFRRCKRDSSEGSAWWGKRDRRMITSPAGIIPYLYNESKSIDNTSMLTVMN